MCLSATSIHYHLDHGHTGWQHHRYRHQLPAEQEDFERCKPGKTTGLQQVVMVEQEGLMRQCSQYEHCPGSGDQQPGPQHKCPAWALGPLSRLVGIGQMQHRHHVPLSLGNEAECSLNGVMVLQVQIVT